MKKIKVATILTVILVIFVLLGIRIIISRQEVSEASVAQSNLLGINVRDITESERVKLGTDKGVVVTAVYANSLAEQQGFQTNDVILAINGSSVENSSDYKQIIDKSLMKESLVFRVKRDTEIVEIRLTAEYAAAYNNLGNAYVKDKQYDKAIEAYKKALSMDKEFAVAYYNLGSVYAKQEKYDMAVENYKKAIDNRQAFQEAYYKLAEVYSQQGKYEDAVNTYKQCIQSSPSDTITSELKSVEVIRAAQGEIKKQLEVSGTVESRTRVTIFPKVAGVIEQMKVKKGSRVEKDQVLAVLEHDELELQVEQAEATLASAQAGYDQALQLSKVNIMSQLAQARAGSSAAEAALQQVRDLAETRMEAQFEQAKAALDALNANLEKIRRGAREEEREQIKATVSQAEANLTSIQSNYERMKKLFEDGAISKQTYEGIQTQLEVAQAQHKAAQQQWKMVQEGARQEDIQAMVAQVKQAEAGFKLAKEQAEKQTWQKDIAMAEAQAEQARAALESAEKLVEAKGWEAEVTAAKTQLTQAKVMLELAQKQLADAYIKAPIQGIVSIRHLDEGNMANPAVALFEMVDMDVVHAKVDVMESDLKKFSLGDIAEIHTSSLDMPVQGNITLVSPTVDEMSRTAQVEVSVKNPEHKLKPGVFAQVFIPVEVRSNAVLLPRSAVIEDEANDEKYVYVVDSAGKSRKTPVEYGLNQGHLVEIASGLDAGISVVISGQQNLNDGDFVQVVKVIE